jgi:hypothetical protein
LYHCVVSLQEMLLTATVSKYGVNEVNKSCRKECPVHVRLLCRSSLSVTSSVDPLLDVLDVTRTLNVIKTMVTYELLQPKISLLYQIKP